MIQTVGRCALVLGGLALLLAPGSVRAQDGPRGWYIEGFAGNYVSDIGALDEDTPYGIRLGVRPSQGLLGLDLEFGSLDGSADAIALGPTGPIDLRYSADAIDVSLSLYPIAGDRFQLMLFGGPGWAFVSAQATTEVDENINRLVGGINDDTLTANLGLGGKIFFSGGALYLRLDARTRWYEQREDDEYDQELTVGIGFNFGG